MEIEQGKIEVNGVVYDIVTLDYETFYSKEYTLTGKMNMSEYIRDDRFHVHGVAIKKNNGKTLWYTERNIRLALDEIDWSRTALLCHNTAFDGMITAEVYGHVPAFYLDTLSMSRATRGHSVRHDLDTVAKSFGHGGKVKKKALVDTKDKLVLTKQEVANLGAYSIDDVEDTYRVFWDMYPHLPDDELRLIDITMRMFCDPVLLVDIQRVEQELSKELGGKAAALFRSGVSPEQLMSNKKFAELIEATGAKLPKKISLSTGKETYAFAKSDIAFQELMNSGNKQVHALCEARLRIKSTIGETRANRFLEAGRNGKKLPILLNYSGAHTHRWSGGNKMNLQNLKRGGELRRSILAPAGQVVVVADSAQIEARVLAWLAQQMDVVAAFAANEDIYKLMASVIYGKPVADITKDERFIGKVCVLGLGFGMGPQKLRMTLKQGALGGPPVDMSESECQRIVNIYRRRNWRIKQFWARMDQFIVNMTVGVADKEGPLTCGKGFIQLPNGLFLQYFGLHGTAEVSRGDLVMTETTYLTQKGRAKLYGGLLTENVVQALARVIIGEQMLKIHDAGHRIVTMTHDEIVVVADMNKGQETLDFMIKTMSTPPDWAPGLPLSAEGGFDVCYSK
jgi:DNA polymerase